LDQHTSNGYYDAFLNKVDSSGNFQWSRAWGNIGDDEIFGVTTDAFDFILACGFFEVSVDFDPGITLDEHISNGDGDALLCKYKPDGNW
jgi:hypothetical protein